MRLFNRGIIAIIKSGITGTNNTASIPKTFTVTSLPHHLRLVSNKIGHNNNREVLLSHPRHHHQYPWEISTSYCTSSTSFISDYNNNLVNSRDLQQTWSSFRRQCEGTLVAACDTESSALLPNMVRECIDLTSDDDEGQDSRALPPPNHFRFGSSTAFQKKRPGDARPRAQEGNISFHSLFLSTIPII